jgi:hypothetical protein
MHYCIIHIPYTHLVVVVSSSANQPTQMPDIFHHVYHLVSSHHHLRQTPRYIFPPSTISPPSRPLPSISPFSTLSILPSPHPTKRCSPSIKPNTHPQIPSKPRYIRINLPRALRSRARNRTSKPALGTQARELESPGDDAIVKDETGRHGPWRDGGGVGLGETEGAGGFDVEELAAWDFDVYGGLVRGKLGRDVGGREGRAYP